MNRLEDELRQRMHSLRNQSDRTCFGGYHVLDDEQRCELDKTVDRLATVLESLTDSERNLRYDSNYDDGRTNVERWRSVRLLL